MFVIVQCLRNIETGHAEASAMDPRRKIGLTLKNAGVAITLTSVTDIMAFIAGSFTILPGLYDFCLMSAATIAAIYFFQARCNLQVIITLVGGGIGLGFPRSIIHWRVEDDAFEK